MVTGSIRSQALVASRHLRSFGASIGPRTERPSTAGGVNHSDIGGSRWRRIDTLESFQCRVMEEVVDGGLNADELRMERARLAFATDSAAEGTGVGGIVALEEAIDVLDANFLRFSGEHETTARTGRAAHQACPRKNGQDLREERTLQISGVRDFSDGESGGPAVVNLGESACCRDRFFGLT